MHPPLPKGCPPPSRVAWGCTSSKLGTRWNGRVDPAQTRRPQPGPQLIGFAVCSLCPGPRALAGRAWCRMVAKPGTFLDGHVSLVVYLVVIEVPSLSGLLQLALRRLPRARIPVQGHVARSSCWAALPLSWGPRRGVVFSLVECRLDGGESRVPSLLDLLPGANRGLAGDLGGEVLTETA